MPLPTSCCCCPASTPRPAVLSNALSTEPSRLDNDAFERVDVERWEDINPDGPLDSARSRCAALEGDGSSLGAPPFDVVN